MQLKGRHWIVLWLLLFLAVAGVVIERQTRAYVLADTLGAIEDRRQALEAEAADLRRSIEAASSRAVIGRRAEELGLRAATDAEYVLFPLPPADASR